MPFAEASHTREALWLLLATIMLTPCISTAGMSNDLYEKYGVEIIGFAELLGGLRLQDDAVEKRESLGEAKLRIDANTYLGESLLTLKSDFIVDGITEAIDAELREFSLISSPLKNMDIKLGRFVSTWGTGDLLFINDTFAKDWQSFFIGRNEEYLKHPENSIKVSLFFETANLDVIYSPLFENSRFISGERLSYYNPVSGKIVGRDTQLNPDEPSTLFSDSETHGRLSKTLNGVELALYGYSGFWKEPEGYSLEQQRTFFPRLNVWGGSARTAILGGVGNIEIGYYDSIDNADSDDPLVRPSETRILLGFERELAHEFTGSLQYYVESILHYDNYTQALSPEANARDENTGMLTLRLTKLTLNQNLNISLFVFYSPDRDDGYARPKISYKLTDHWLVNAGLNLFWGEEDYTFWGQFEKNTNIYTGLRYNF